MGMAQAPVQSTAPNSKRILRFCAHMHSRVVAHAHICGAHFDIESGISQLLDGPRSCPLEGAVCGCGAGSCAKHSCQLRAAFEIFCAHMQKCLTAHARVPSHDFACAHKNLKNRLELAAVLCTGAFAISIYNTLQRAASRAV